MYFDHSATTPVHPEVQKLISDTQAYIYGNPSSNHFLGRKARLLLEKSRNQVANAINTAPEQIIFNSGELKALTTFYGQWWKEVKIILFLMKLNIRQL